jgi:hypothetical protein
LKTVFENGLVPDAKLRNWEKKTFVGEAAEKQLQVSKVELLG